MGSWPATAAAQPVTFEVEVPHCTPHRSPVMLRSNRLEAGTFRHDPLTRVEPTLYRGTFEVAVDRSSFRYKYSHGECGASACPGIEKALDFTGSGGEIDERVLPDGADSVRDLVFVWRSAVTRVDGDGQVVGVRPSDEHVSFCAPYLSVSRTDGTLAVGYDSYDAADVVLELGETESYGRRLTRTDSHRNHFELTDLAPGRTYHYRVVEGGVAGPDHVLRAPPSPGQPFRFAFLGDSQYYVEQQRFDTGRAVELIEAFDPDLVLSPGDMVASERGPTGPGGWSYPEPGRWNVFFGLVAPLMARAPFMAAMGNHEEDAPYFWSAFRFPEPDAPAIDHYFFRYGHVHFTVLYTGSTDGYDMGAILDSQTSWMERALEAADMDPEVRFKVVVLHRGPLSEGRNHTTDGMAFWETEAEARPAWRSLWERHGVDLVLAGHNHNFTLGELGGVRYITSCGGAPVHPLRSDRLPTTLATEQRCTADLFSVRERTLSFEPLRLDGTPIEEGTFTLCREATDCAELASPCDAVVTWACAAGVCEHECAASGDGGVGPDGGMGVDGGLDAGADGGTDGGRDGGARVDGGTPPPGDPGCSCGVPEERPRAPHFPLLALGLLAMVWARRRSRR